MSRYTKGRDFALQILGAQIVSALIASAISLAISYPIAVSILVGGVISVTANFWLVLVAFRPQLGASPEKMLSAFYVGELGKFIFTALMFLVAFKQIGFLKEAAYAATMILAYVMVQGVAWIYPLVRSR